MFEIYFCDLTPEAQEQFLSVFGLSCAEEGNFDVFPIVTIPLPDGEGEED